MSNKITTDQVAELLAQDKAGRVTRELLQAFLRNPHGYTSVQSEKYLVTIDYTKSLEDMIVVGRYDWHNDNINSTNFPLVAISQSNSPDQGPYRTPGKNGNMRETSVELVHLNKVVRTNEVETYFEANGLRAATLAELLAFGATYPEIQREFPVIAHGSSWVNPHGCRRVPFLYGDGSERCLLLSWYDDVWDERCRFLAVRK